MSQVGLTEALATQKYGACVIGRAEYSDLARGKIARSKRAAEAGRRSGRPPDPRSPDRGRGGGRADHLGQQAIIHSADVDSFVDNIFNFPTLAEAYRVAALDIVRQRRALFPAGPGELAPAPAGCH